MTTNNFTYLSAQFDPNSIRRIASEIERQKDAKRDYLLPLSAMSYNGDGSLVLDRQTFTVGDRVYIDFADAEGELDRLQQLALNDDDSSPDAIKLKIDGLPKIEVADAGAPIAMLPTARQQLFSRMDVPKRFADSLVKREAGDVLSTMMSELMSRETKRVMLRCLDGGVRAIVSDRYRALDNSDLFYAAATQFQQAGASMWKARLSDDSFELFGVADHIAGEVRLDRTFDPGDGWMSRWAGKSGDAQNAAVRITNSETGRGGLGVAMSVVTKICANFCVWGENVAVIHSGRQLEADDNGLIIKSDQTRELESRTVWSKINDAIATAFDATAFQKMIDAMNDATQREIPEDRVEAAVDNVVAEFTLDEASKASILDEILSTGDRSQYGLMQATTHAAHANDRKGDSEKASGFEDIGAAILAKTPAQFEKLLAIN